METLRDLFEAGLAEPKQRHLRWRTASGAWAHLSTEQVREQVEMAGRGFAALGLEPGDRVGLISRNSERWALADFALVGTGLVDVPLYPTSTPEQVSFLLEDSGARVLLVEDREQLARLGDSLARVSLLRVVLLRDEEGCPEGVLSWTGLLEMGRAAAPVTRRPVGGDLASLIYTSGTTGGPKGVMLSHRNLVSNALACSEAIDLSRVPQVNLSLLPLCHVFQRLVDYFLWLNRAEVVSCSNPLEAVDWMQEVRPTFFAAVPRLFEKVRAGFFSKLAQAGPRRRRLLTWALETGRRRFHAELGDGRGGGPVGLRLGLSHALADRLVLRKVRAVFGGRVDMCFSGGAALSPEVHEFFRSVGLEILPGYGLTETSPVLCTNRRGRMRLGSVGQALPGVELRTEADGELLARGPNIMMGYWKRPEDTAATMEGEWLRTGDLARIDEQGYVFITGRKKEILVLSTGKNVSPQVVEDHLGRSPLVVQVVVVGDGRKFIAALVAPNFDALRAALGGEAATLTDAELVASPEAERAVLASLQEAARELAPHERPKRVHLLPRELSLGHGELTPTLKYKRRAILANWGAAVDALHEEPAAAAGGEASA